LRRFLEHRRRALRDRPHLIEEYLRRLSTALGGRASIVVFGGRARTGLSSDEPRDLDLLIVVDDSDDPNEIEDLAHALRPRGLPTDIVVVRKRDLSTPLLRKMLSSYIVMHDPLNISKHLATN